MKIKKTIISLFSLFLAIFAVSFFSQKTYAAHSPRYDVAQVALTTDKVDAQVGEDVTFTVTLKNVSSQKKNMEAVCFQSSDGNFGCLDDFNLQPGESFTFSNSGRWVSGGTKSIWITWSQDNVNFYRPLNASRISISVAE